MVHIQPVSDRQDAYSIRFQVFVDEQGIDKALEIDDIDDLPHCHHVVGYQNNVAVATCRLFPYDPITQQVSLESRICKLGRLAVVKQCRGQGVGQEMVLYGIQWARQSGFKTLLLHAQVQAKGFYEKCGFHSIGDVFDEDGVPHVQYELFL